MTSHACDQSCLACLKTAKGSPFAAKRCPVPALSDKDRSDLAFAIDMGVDIIALSFVQTVADIEEARSLIGDKAMIVAKAGKTRCDRKSGRYYRRH